MDLILESTSDRKHFNIMDVNFFPLTSRNVGFRWKGKEADKVRSEGAAKLDVGQGWLRSPRRAKTQRSRAGVRHQGGVRSPLVALH